MDNSKIIDTAILTHIEKYKPQYKDEIYTGVIEAIKKIIFENNYMGITSSNDSRDNLISIGKHGILSELTKHIIKVSADQSINSQVKIPIKKHNLNDPEISEDDVILLLYKKIEEGNIENVQYFLNRAPTVCEKVISSFVFMRYRGDEINVLDETYKSNENFIILVNNVDSYFNLHIEKETD